ncbi:MAG: hypothetical protein ACWGKN_09295 [Desulfoprunum sp.]
MGKAVAGEKAIGSALSRDSGPFALPGWRERERGQHDQAGDRPLLRKKD